MTSGHSLSESDAEAKEYSIVLFWHNFTTEFPTDEDCFEELSRGFAGQSDQCQNCQTAHDGRKPGERAFKCRNCKKLTWITAGSFFDRIRRPRAWLAAIRLLEDGLVVNASRFARMANVAYATAAVIFKKLAVVIEAGMATDAPTVLSADFAAVIAKRSRETPARAHPVAEQEEMERKFLEESEQSCAEADANRQSAVADGPDDEMLDPAIGQNPHTNLSDQRSSQENQVYDWLSEEPIHFDQLCQLTGMEAGEVSAYLTILEFADAAKRMPGDWYVRLVPRQNIESALRASLGAEAKAESTVDTNTFMDFVHSDFQFISRKYLQLYLAAFWCYRDKIRWPRGSLLEACLEFGRIGYAQILAYVSPLLVRIQPLESS